MSKRCMLYAVGGRDEKVWRNGELFPLTQPSKTPALVGLLYSCHKSENTEEMGRLQKQRIGSGMCQCCQIQPSHTFATQPTLALTSYIEGMMSLYRDIWEVQPPPKRAPLEHCMLCQQPFYSNGRLFCCPVPDSQIWNRIKL